MRITGKHISTLTAALLVVLPAAESFAQTPAERLRGWMTGQRDMVESVSSFEMVETTHQSMDGGFGRQDFRTRATLQGGPGAKSPGRTVLQMELNGNEVSKERGSRLRRQHRGLFRPEMGRFVESFRFPIQDLARMQINGAIRREDVGDRSAWRVNAAPKSRPFPVERMSAWFDDESFRLLRTETLLGGPGNQTVRVRTEYARLNGIDVPVHRTMEGSARTRRRMRYFTVLFERSVEYTDIAFVMKD